MLVKYNKVNCWGIGVGLDKKEQAARKKANLPTTSKSVNLVPGVNHVDDKDWAKIKDHPAVERALEDKTLEVLTEKDGKADEAREAGSSVELYSLNADDLVKEKKLIIAECYHKELLLKWQEEEESAGCQAAIAKQLKKLELSEEERAAQKG